MIKFQGTRKELGRWYGQRLQEYHHDGYRTVPNSETLRRQLKIYEKFYPELLTEKLAAAEAMGQDPQFLLYEDLAGFVDSQKRRVNPHQHGCTIFALRENGKTFVGRNYDWLPEAREFFLNAMIGRLRARIVTLLFRMKQYGVGILANAAASLIAKMRLMSMDYI